MKIKISLVVVSLLLLQGCATIPTTNYVREHTEYCIGVSGNNNNTFAMREGGNYRFHHVTPEILQTFSECMYSRGIIVTMEQTGDKQVHVSLQRR